MVVAHTDDPFLLQVTRIVRGPYRVLDALVWAHGLSAHRKKWVPQAAGVSTGAARLCYR